MESAILSSILNATIFGSSILLSRYFYHNKLKRKKFTDIVEKTCTLSAPGKALVAGGYLVLDSSIGVTLASTSRFFSTVKCIKGDSDNNDQILTIVIESPQFHSKFTYEYHIPTFTLKLKSETSNEFIEKCLEMFFAFAKVYIGVEDFTKMLHYIQQSGVLGIKLRADNDFYSQIMHLKVLKLPLLSSSLKELPRFLPCPKDPVSGKVMVFKTGMGSSAALTTALIGSLLQFFNITTISPSMLSPPPSTTTTTPSSMTTTTTTTTSNNTLSKYNLTTTNIAISKATSTDISGDIDSDIIPLDIYKEENDTEYDLNRKIVHNLSQLAHAVAQGKLGSGFDIAAAVYGSQFYRRFNPEPFQACMDNTTATDTIIYNAVMNFSLWTQEIIQLSLPPMLQLMMGDVCGGSSSTSMAKQVLKWRKEEPEIAEELWRRLHHTNTLISQSMISLSNKLLTCDEKILKLVERRVEQGINWLTSEDNFENESSNMDDIIIAECITLRKLFKIARTSLKSMGEYAGVGIEPDEQTRLADATEAIPGVLCAGVPGAGGVDAIFAIVLSSQARDRVETLWSTWGKYDLSGNTAVCPLILSADNHDHPGIRLEPSLGWD